MGLSLKKRLTDNFLTRGASRAFDQVNVFDNNRTWQQTTPTQSKSTFQQAGQLGGQTARAVGGATAKTLNTVGAGLSQVPATIRGEVAMRTGNQKALDNALVAQKNMREQVYGSQNSGLLGKGTIYKSVDDYLNPDINSSNPLDDIIERTKRFSGLGAESALELASLGVGGVAGKELVKQGVKQGLKTQAPKIAGNAVLNTTQGGLNAYNQGGSAKDIAKSALISGTVGTVADVGLGIAGAGLSKAGKSQIKPVEAYYDPKVKPKVTLKNSPNTNPLESLKQAYNKMDDETLVSTVNDLERYGSTDNPTYKALKEVYAERKLGGIQDELRKQDVAKQTKQVEATKAKKDLDGFTDNKSSVQRGKIEKTLDSQVRYNGEVMSKRDYIRKLVKDGYVPDEKSNSIYSPNDRSSYQVVTKTEADYARHLATQSQPPKSPLKTKVTKETPQDLNGKPLNTGDKVTIKDSTISSGDWVVKELRGGKDGIAIVAREGKDSSGLLGFTNEKAVGQHMLIKGESKPPLTVEKNTPSPVVKPKVEFKAPDQIKSAQKQTLESIAEKPKAPAESSLFGGMTPEQYIKNRPKVELKKPELSEVIAKQDTENVSKQMVEQLGISKQTADELLATNNKPALVTNLYGSKDLIKNADNPDAYARKIMANAQDRGQQAAKQNMLLDSEPNLVVKQASRVDELRQYGVDLDQKIKSVEKEFNSIYSSIKKEGFDLEDLGRKQVLAERGEYSPSVKEVEMFDQITNRLNEAFDKSGIDMDGFRNYYRPQTKQGSVKLPTTREELLDFGYKKQRTDALQPDEIDYGIQPLVDYVVKAEFRPTMIKASIVDAAEVDGRALTKQGVEKAAELSETLQKKVHDKAKSKGVLTNDTTGELLEIGKNEGYKQEIVTYSPGKIMQEPKAMLEKANLWNRGFKQYDNSTAYATEFARQLGENKVSVDQVGDALERVIRAEMPGVENSTINGIKNFVTRSIEKNNLKPEEAVGLYNNAFKSAAKAELFRIGKTIDFTNNKMRKVTNEQINERLLNSSYGKNFAQEFDSFLSERFNVSLRGMNIVSAGLEAGDYANIGAQYGYKDIIKGGGGLTKVDGSSLSYSHRYGQAGIHYLTNDIPQVQKFSDIMKNPKMSTPKKIYEIYRTAENKALAFKYVEQHKTEMFFRAADDFYRKKGLQGSSLVDAVMEDYHKVMLPHSIATANRVIGKMPNVLTQYLNWSLQATKRFGRTVSGSNTGGKFGDMGQAERIARGITTEILPKATAAVVLGIPIMQVMGMRDFTGATDGDFSGIPEEDKTRLDTVMDMLSVSPATSMLSNYYFAHRRNDLATQRKEAGETYKAEPLAQDTMAEVTKQNLSNLIPFKTQFKKSKDVWDASQRGYYENREGRVQLEAPQGASMVANMITGKTYSPRFREYQDVPNVLSVINGTASPKDLIVKNKSVSNLVQAVSGKSTNDYQRPLSGSLKDSDGNIIKNKAGEEILGYSDTAKQAFKQAEEKHGKGSEQSKVVLRDWIKDGREYNKLYDNFKKVPGAEELLEEYYSKNILTPEKWKLVQGDEKLWNYIKGRKQLEARDLGREIDPIFKDTLPDGTKITPERSKLMLQERATITGDDMRQREMLYRTDWYGKVKDAESTYFSTFNDDGGSPDKTQRVLDWNKLSEQAFSPDKGLASQDKYKSITEYNDKLDTFENYDSDERKAFTKAWYNANPNFNDLKTEYELERLKIVNEMRKIEGAEPLTEEQFLAKFEFPTKDENGKWGFNNGWSSGSKNNTPTAAYTKVPQGETLSKVSFKSSSPEIRTKKSVKRRPRPKLQLKKSMV